MISVFLDESGNFENMNYKLKFIGGLIYTGNDLEEEKHNLEKYLEKVCQDLKIVYPNDIHTTKINHKSKWIEKALRESLINHLYNNGKYHFVYMVCGSNRKTYIQNTSNIVEEEIASNLYDNMAANLIQNILFYNPYITNKNYHLNIASRIAKVNKKDISKIKEYERLGYLGILMDGGKNYIYFLNSNTSIKAAISSKIIESRINKDIDTIDLNVEKINYRKTKRDKNLPTTPFLYAADIACNLIKNVIADVSDSKNKYRNLKGKLTNIDREDLYIFETVKELEKISGTKALAWAYDDIEGLWGDLNLAVCRKDFLFALDCLYDIKTNNSPFSKFYYGFWCSKIIEDLESIFNEDQIDLYIGKIETYSLSKDKAKYEKGLFLAEHIESYLQGSKIKNGKHYLFKLNDILLRGYNHRGDTINGHKCVSKCKENRDFVDTQTYVQFLNRELQTYVNEFNYDKCIEISQEIEYYLEVLKDTEEEIAKCLGKKITGNIERGKIYSSLGQFYSFKMEKDKALDYFLKALEELKDSDVNTKTTISYLLHLAIENRDFVLFNKYREVLWQSSDLGKIFKSIIDKQNRYELYLYLKALDIFYINHVSDELWNRIITFDYNENGFEQVHPWELIYKYMAIICLKKQLRNTAQNMIDKIDEIKDMGETIMLININFKIEYLQLDYKLNKKPNGNKIDKLLNTMEDILNKYPNIGMVFKPIMLESGKLQLDKLNTIFTYMYR